MSGNKFRVRVAVVGVVAAAAGILGAVTPSEASARVEGIAIGTYPGYGSVAGHYGAGCTYKVAAMVDDTAPSAQRVSITSRRLGGPAVRLVDVKPTRRVVSANWTPPAPGTYVLTATQGSSSRSLRAQVGIGVQFPPFFGRGQCAVLIP